MSRSIVLSGNFPRNNDKFLVFSKDVATKEQGNPLLTNAPVQPSDLQKLISDFEDTVGKKGPGWAEKRKAAREKVEVALRQNEAFTEAALAKLAPADIPAAAEGSGFAEKKRGKRNKPGLAVLRGKVQGDAICEIKALGRHGTIQYCIAYSVDGGVTWIDMAPTIDVAMTFHNLPVAKTVLFRFRTLIKGVYGDWSHNEPFLVH
jgi:hypothetical protein